MPTFHAGYNAKLAVLTFAASFWLFVCRFFIKDACLSPAAAEQLHVEAWHLQSLGNLTSS